MNSSNYIIGQVYYLVIDGCGADICDYEIEVIEGSTTNVEITAQTGEIQGDTSFCTGEFATFRVDSVEFASHYEWTMDSTVTIINGQGTNEIEIFIEAEDSIQICVTAVNGCFVGSLSCLTINNIGTVQSNTIIESICEGDSIEFQGEFYDESGIYYFVFPDTIDCDSIVYLSLELLPHSQATIDTLLDSGGTYNGIFYDTDTTIVENYISENGCDSTVTINIMVKPNAVVFPKEIEELKIFPNPASNQIFIQIELSETIEIQFGIFNTLGQKVLDLNSQKSYFKGTHTIELNASQLPNGAYFLQFKTENWSFAERLVIAR